MDLFKNKWTLLIPYALVWGKVTIRCLLRFEMSLFAVNYVTLRREREEKLMYRNQTK